MPSVRTDAQLAKSPDHRATKSRQGSTYIGSLQGGTDAATWVLI